LVFPFLLIFTGMLPASQSLKSGAPARSATLQEL